MSRARRFLAVLALGTGTVMLASCVSVPDAGPVRSGPVDEESVSPGSFDYDPAGPEPGAEPADIIAGFIDAQRESPLTFAAARAFLTPEAVSTWAPGRRTVVYGDGALGITVSGAAATLSISDSVELDDRGSWLGDPTSGSGLSLGLSLALVGGEWRISDPPDALVIPRSHFDSRYVRYDLHFFDPAARVVVPEPVYVSAGSEAPTNLVSGLLAGPDADLASVSRTFFPPGTGLEFPVSVANGIADVALSEEILEADRAQIDLAMAQLAWTLRQVPGLERMRVTVDDTPVDRTTGASARSLFGWSSYAPWVAAASPDLVGLRREELVTAGPDGTAAVSQAFAGVPLRSLAQSLSGPPDGIEVAAVTANGRTVLTTALRALPGDVPATQAYVGTDVVGLSYDRTGRLWLVDRTSEGARVVVVTGPRARTVRAPGITGQDVTDLTVSRDGTRLAAVVDRAVTVSRISRAEDGRPIRVQDAMTLTQEALGFDVRSDRVLDLAWASPSTLAALVRLERSVSQVVLASVDGSWSAGGPPEEVEALFERGRRVLTWPGTDAPLYVEVAGGRLYQLSPGGGWQVPDQPSGLDAPAFPG